MNELVTKFYGWKLVAVFFAVYFLNGAFPFYGGVVINSLMSVEMGLDRSTLGLGFTLYSITFGLSGTIVGVLVTRIGARKTLLYGCAVLVVGTLLMAFAVSTAWHYVLYFGVVIGMGVGLGSVIPIQTSLTFWFKRRRAAAMAIVMSAAGLSALLTAPLLAFIVDSTGSWRMGWVAVTIAAIIAAVIVALGAVDKPEDIGQHPDGVDPRIAQTGSDTDSYQKKIYQSPDSWSVAETIKTRAWWLMVLGSYAFFGAFYIAMGHGVVHLLDLGHSKELASFSVGLLVACSIAGRMLAGWLGDRYEPRYIWSVALGMMFIGIFLLKNGSSVPTVYAYAATLGVGMGASYVCMITLTGNYFGADAYAQIAGILFPISIVLAALSPILAGIAYDMLGSYRIAFYGTMVITFLGAWSILFATPPRKVPRP